MKGKILASARKVFGEYGYHGTTTRMIAKNVGIDISTLYYHWGEKRDLYEAVVMDLNEEIRQKLLEIE
ncbi:MAG: TetR/AcrR family transcriptional regulator, partial [Proteobacteria bacterium]|nr:TetR/AcrR family transcriptional regulator [Pseudomonadota bacterium]